MEQKMCWKCREFLQNKFGERYYLSPSNHCHHPELEEKPKEPCWCDEPTLKIVTILDRVINDVVEIQFCPVCGKRKKEWGK